MNRLKAKSFDNFFVSLYTGHLILLFPILLLADKGDVVLWINSLHTPQWDVFFKYGTHLGDGILFVPLILILLFVRFYDALLAIFSAIGHGLIIYVFKKLIFNSDIAIRPIGFFNDLPTIDLVDGVTLHSYRSFPSGHTASGFVLALVLTIAVGRKSWAAFFWMLALIVGLSRIYLLQHFFMDVYTGSAIAIFTVLLSWMFLENSTWFKGKAWLNQSLLTVFNKRKPSQPKKNETAKR